MRLRAPAIAAAAAAALTLTGCGSGGTEATGEDPASTKAAPTAPVFDPEVFDKKAAAGDSARVGQTIRAYSAADVIEKVRAGAAIAADTIETVRAETGSYPKQEDLLSALNDRPKADQDVLASGGASYLYETPTPDTWTMEVTTDEVSALKISYRSGQDEPVIEGAYTAPKVSDPIKTKDDLYAHAAVIIRNEAAINGVKGAYELDSLDESQVRIDQSVADGLTQVAKEHGVTVHVVKFKDVNATFNLAAEGVGVISIDLDGVYRETKPEDLSS